MMVEVPSSLFYSVVLSFVRLLDRSSIFLSSTLLDFYVFLFGALFCCRQPQNRVSSFR